MVLEKKDFELVKILAGKQKIDLVVRYLPMVKHKFVLNLQVHLLFL